MACWYNVQSTVSQKIKLVDAWCKSINDGKLLDRGDFDPSCFKAVLPFLLIAEIQPPFRLLYRLAGTSVVTVAGINVVGHYLDELVFTGRHEPWLDRYKQAYRSRRPVYGVCSIDMMIGDAVSYEHGIWPLTNGGVNVRQFLAVEDYGDLCRRSRPVLIQALPASAVASSDMSPNTKFGNSLAASLRSNPRLLSPLNQHSLPILLVYQYPHNASCSNRLVRPPRNLEYRASGYDRTLQRNLNEMLISFFGDQRSPSANLRD